MLGFGNACGPDLRVLDRTGRGDLQATYRVTQRFVAALNKTPAIKGAFSGFNPNFPQYLIHLAADLAAIIETAPESLSRILSEFQQKGIIELTRKSIELLQPEQLRLLK